MEKNLKTRYFICITESLCYTTETNTTLLINYTPILNKKLKRNLKKKTKKPIWIYIKDIYI